MRILNFDADDDSARSAYGAQTCDRLPALKPGYDPTNLFSRNQNVKAQIVPGPHPVLGQR